MMNESAFEGPKLQPNFRDIGRVIVSGYDTSYSLPLEVAKSTLEKHFSSCGEITDVAFDDRSAYVYFVGEGAVDKALQLNDSNLDGWKLTVKPFPFRNAKDKIIVSVEGFDTCLSQDDLESALTPLFSPYGMIEILLINEKEGSALAAIYGENIADKASELNGFYMGERKLAVRWLSVPRIHSVHSLPFRKGPTLALLDSDSSTSDAKVSSGRTEIGPHFGVLAKALRISGGDHVHAGAVAGKLEGDDVAIQQSSSKTTHKPPQMKMKSSEEQQTAVRHELFVEDIHMGDPNGKEASVGKWVSVHLTGSLKKNGQVFYSSVGKPPVEFCLGEKHVIKGLDVGITGMRVGGKRKLTIPPEMGYGAEGTSKNIPPHAWLVFEVELADSDSSTSDEDFPSQCSESSKTPEQPPEKKRKSSEEEQQTPDRDELFVDDLRMGDPNGKKVCSFRS